MFFWNEKIGVEKNMDINIDVKNCQGSIYDVFRTFRALLVVKDVLLSSGTFKGIFVC